jgi:hypothetical protein
MGGFLKQSTAATIPFGPFVDKTDGVTEKNDATCITDIDHATTGIFLSKAGGTAAVRHQNVTASVAGSNAMMKVTLDTTDTGTVGRLRVQFSKAATYLPVFDDYFVLPANVYDSLVGSDLLDISVAQLLGTAWLAPAVAGTPDVNVKTETDHDFTTTQKSDLAAASDIAAAVAAQADIAALIAAWVNGGRLDLLLDSVISEMAKVPKSDSTVSWNATALAAIGTAVKAASSGGFTWDAILHAIADGMTTPPA